MKKILLFLIVLSLSSFSFGQKKYIIYFKDKDVKQGDALLKTSAVYQEALSNLTKRAVERRKKNMGEKIINYQDLPIKAVYLNKLSSLGIKIVHKLTWFNAVSAYIIDEQIIDVKQLDFVEKIEPVNKLRYKKPVIPESHLDKGSLSTPDLNYGNSFGQLELCDIPIVHSKGITGEGIIIGLLDSGFDWKNHEALANIDVLSEWDFVFNDSTTADEEEDVSGQHNHGTSVLSIAGGFKDGTLIGASFGSSFLLAKTEYIPTETHVEEDNYAAALIWMENQGVDVTSSSLGYSEFDEGQSSYTYSDMDGQTTIVTQACELTFDRGVVTISSAGNEGNGSWFYITAPADGFNTIAVGAVTSSNEVASFSSRGPTPDGRIKPDIITQGVAVYAASASGLTNYTASFGGTSAAAPIACGSAALLLSAHPHLTNVQVRNILMQTAGNSGNPDNERGYGLISVEKAISYPNLEIIDSQYKLHKVFINKPVINPNSAKIFYSTDQVNFTEGSLDFDGQLRFDYDFPALQNNQLVYFYFSYQDSGGGSFREPAVENYQFNYGELVISLDIELSPTNYILKQNYPNPFNPSTTIEFEIPNSDFVTLKIYDILGNEIRTLISEPMETGKYKIDFGAAELASGVYVYQLRVGNFLSSKKMMLLK